MERAAGRRRRAVQSLHSAFRARLRVYEHPELLLALSIGALLTADAGAVERAVELYALAARHPLVANSRWFENVAGRYLAAAAATLPPEVVVAAQKRGRARELWATVEELLTGLGQ